jgi:hypothetical protein
MARIIVAAIVMVLAASRPARADDLTARLAFAGDACDREAIELRVRELAHRDPFDPAAAWVVDVRIEARDDVVKAAVRLLDPEGVARGERSVEAKSCTALSSSVALVIAMALAQPQPVAVPSVDEPTRVEPVVPPPGDAAPRGKAGAPSAIAEAPRVKPVAPSAIAEAPPVKPVAPSAIAEAPRGEPVRVEPPRIVEPVAVESPAGTLVDDSPSRFGVLGGVTSNERGLAAMLLGARYRSGARSISLELGVHAADSRAIAPGTIAITRRELAAVPCHHFGPVAACVPAVAGVFAGRGEDLPVTQHATTPFVTLGGRVAWESRLAKWVALRVHVEVDALLTRNRFLIDDMPVWSAGAVEAHGGMSFVANIP